MEALTVYKTPERKRLYQRQKYAQEKAWREEQLAADPGWWRKQHLWSEYRMTPEDYDLLLHSQAGCCAICASEKNLRVDHNHETGAVRGILCHRCNIGVGYAENHEWLSSVQAYLAT